MEKVEGISLNFLLYMAYKIRSDNKEDITIKDIVEMVEMKGEKQEKLNGNTVDETINNLKSKYHHHHHHPTTAILNESSLSGVSAINAMDSIKDPWVEEAKSYVSLIIITSTNNKNDLMSFLSSIINTLMSNQVNISDGGYDHTPIMYDDIKLKQDVFVWIDFLCLPFKCISFTSSFPSSITTTLINRSNTINSTDAANEMSQDEDIGRNSNDIHKIASKQSSDAATILSDNYTGESNDKINNNQGDGVFNHHLPSSSSLNQLIFDEHIYTSTLATLNQSCTCSIALIDSFHSPDIVYSHFGLLSFLFVGDDLVAPSLFIRHQGMAKYKTLFINVSLKQYEMVRSHLLLGDGIDIRKLVDFVEVTPQPFASDKNEGISMSKIKEIDSADGIDGWRHAVITRMCQWLSVTLFYDANGYDENNNNLICSNRSLQCVMSTLIDCGLTKCACHVLSNLINVSTALIDMNDIIHQELLVTLCHFLIDCLLKAWKESNHPIINALGKSKASELNNIIVDVVKISHTFIANMRNSNLINHVETIHKYVTTLVEIGEYESALPYAQKELSIYDQLTNEGSLQQSTKMKMIENIRIHGLIQQSRGQYNEAISYFNKCLELNGYDNQSGHAANMDVVDDLYKLANLYESVGNLDEAFKLVQNVISIVSYKQQNANLSRMQQQTIKQSTQIQSLPISQLINNGNQALIVSTRKMAQILHKQKKYLDALKLMEKCLVLTTNDHGQYHEEVLHDLAMMSEILHDMNNYSGEARVHQLIENVQHGIAKRHLLEEELVQKLQFYESLLAKYKDSMFSKKSNIELYLCTKKISDIYVNLNQNKDAIEFLEKSLVYSKINNDDDENRIIDDDVKINDMDLLAQLYISIGNIKRSIDLLNSLKTLLHKTRGSNDVSIASVSLKLAQLYNTCEKYVQAEELSRDVIRIYQLSENDKHPSCKPALTKAETCLYMALWAQGRCAQSITKKIKIDSQCLTPEKKSKLLEAETIFRKLLSQTVNEASGGNKIEIVGESYVNLSKLLFDAGDLDTAFEECCNGVNLFHKFYGSDHPVLLSGLQVLADIELRRGRVDKAESIVKEQLRIISANYGEDHAMYASYVLLHLVPVLRAYEDKDVLDNNYEMVYQMFHIAKKIYGTSSLDIALLMVSIGEYEYDMDNMEQSEELVKGALKIYKSHFGNDLSNQYIKSVCDVLTAVYSKIETQILVDDSLNIDGDDDPNTEDERDMDRRTEGEFSSSSGHGNSPNDSERSTPPTEYILNERAQSNDSDEQVIPNGSTLDSCQTESEKRTSTLISGGGQEQGSTPANAENRVNSSMCMPHTADLEDNNDFLEDDEPIQRKKSKQSVRSHGSKNSKVSKKMKELEEEEEAVRMIHASSLSDMKSMKKASKDELLNRSPRAISPSFSANRSRTTSYNRKRTKSSRSLTLESTVIPVSNSKYAEDDKKKYYCNNSTCSIL